MNEGTTDLTVFIAFFSYTNVGGPIGAVFGAYEIDNPWFQTKS